MKKENEENDWVGSIHQHKESCESQTCLYDSVLGDSCVYCAEILILKVTLQASNLDQSGCWPGVRRIYMGNGGGRSKSSIIFAEIMADCQLEGVLERVNLKRDTNKHENGLYPKTPSVQYSRSSCPCLFCGHWACAGFNQLCMDAT